jgi:hypothetical protein
MNLQKFIGFETIFSLVSVVINIPTFFVYLLSLISQSAPSGRPVIRSFIRSFVRLFVRSFVRSFVRLFVCSFVRSFFCSFVRSSGRFQVFFLSSILPLAIEALTRSNGNVTLKIVKKKLKNFNKIRRIILAKFFY